MSGQLDELMKPMPVPDADSGPYWQGANEGRFLFQRCATCRKAQFYPRSLCSHCQSRELNWEESKGRGKVASFSVVHRAPIPAFKADSPYVVALIDLEEGFRFMCNVIRCDPQSVRIGDPVRIVYETRPGSYQKIPQAEQIR